MSLCRFSAGTCRACIGWAAAGLMILVAACTPSADVADQPAPAKPDSEPSAAVPQPKGAPAFYPDGRLFVCRMATGLDPKGQIEHLPRHVQTLPEIHERFVYEFTLKPGFGMDRYHWRPGEWAELLVDSSIVPAAPVSSDRKYPARDAIQVDAREDGKRYLQRPKYSEKAETLTFPSETLGDVIERIWQLEEMHLVGIAKHKEPVVYLGEGGENHMAAPDKAAKKLAKARAGGNQPSRPPDTFESAALGDLRKGTELVVKTTAAEMRLVGAIRARADCVACHDGGEGALLGAFTYRLAWKSGATEPRDRLVDRADLTPEELRAIETIEAIGGTVQRDPEGTNRPVSKVNLHHAKFKDAGLQTLVPFAGLKTVDVSYTKVTDAGVRQMVAQHPHLVDVNLSGTKITDAGLKDLRALKDLRTLSLWTTSITDAGLPHIRACAHLEKLELAQTSVTNAGVKEITGLKKLRVLSLFNSNGISDPVMQHVKEMTGLEELDLARTAITDAGLPELTGLKQLRKLDLSLTEVTDAGLVHIAKMPQLRTLRLNSVKKMGSGLKELQHLTELETLELGVNNLTDAMVQNLAKLTQLKSLELGNSELTDVGLRTLRNFDQLESLDLWHASVTDAGMQNLKGLVRLRNLGLGHTQITDAGLDAPTGLQQLKKLDLTDTKVTDAGVARLKQALPELEITR